MRALAYLQARRRLSGAIVAALLLFGVVGSFHHHKLAAPAQSLAIGVAAGESHPARSIDCVVCRAADPVHLVAVREPAPPLAVAHSVIHAFAAPVSAATSRSFSPRAPPAAA